MSNDHPFTIQGLQIEPAEVEAALLDLGLLREAAVVVHEYRFGGPRLAAYVVSATQPAPTPGELQTALRRRWPGNAPPLAFILMDALPRAASGAVDRVALPAPYAARPALGNAYQRPGNPLEQLLTEVWEDCLNVRPVGVGDHFFELGGDSLLASQMLLAVEELVGKSLAPEVLFHGATVKDLAGELLRPFGAEPPARVVEVQPGDPARRLFFLHGDYNGGGLYCLNLARRLGRRQGFYALPPLGLAGAVTPQTIEEMAAEHLEALTAFQAEGPYLLGGHCNGALVALEMAQQLRRLGRPAEQVVLIAPPRKVPGESPPPVPYMGPTEPGPDGGRPLRLDLSQLSPEARRRALHEIYSRVCGRYRLHPYPGRLGVVEPQAEMVGDAATSGWRQAAPVVDFAVVPGDHLTILTEHVEALAEVLRTLLARRGAE